MCHSVNPWLVSLLFYTWTSYKLSPSIHPSNEATCASTDTECSSHSTRLNFFSSSSSVKSPSTKLATHSPVNLCANLHHLISHVQLIFPLVFIISSKFVEHFLLLFLSFFLAFIFARSPLSFSNAIAFIYKHNWTSCEKWSLRLCVNRGVFKCQSRKIEGKRESQSTLIYLAIYISSFYIEIVTHISFDIEETEKYLHSLTHRQSDRWSRQFELIELASCCCRCRWVYLLCLNEQ